MSHKEGYYAALERQRAGESTLRERLEKAGRQEPEDFDALETLYTDVGMKAFTAFNNCLDWLSHLGRGGSGPIPRERLEQTVYEAVSNAVRDVRDGLASLQERFGRLESNIAALEAGMRRIDKFTLEAFRNIQELGEEVRRSTGPGLAAPSQGVDRGRLPKEEAARLALEAGQRMKIDGKRITLAAVAREAGLKYGQIVYAFGNKESFIRALAGSTLEAAMSDGAGESTAFEQTASA